MSAPAAARPCPACDAPRVDGSDCPHCGVIYAKAEARRRVVSEVEDVDAPPATLPALPPLGDDDAWERRLRLVAMPLALIVAWLVVQAGFLRALGRVFLSMWVHELGHAVTAWMTGFAAVPGPWRTFVGEERSWTVTLLVLAAAAVLGRRALRTHTRAWGVAAGLLVVVHLVGRFGPAPHAARALVTFGGDAGMLVLGAALVAAFPVASTNVLRRIALRWGLLVIGAFAFMDAGDTWLRAGRDPDVIPYGSIEGVGHSDPSVLVDDHRWTEEELVARHRAAAALGLAVMGASYVVGLRRSRRA